jgi:XapX domain-containing protein
MNHLAIGTVELEAAVVGLLTGLLYSWVRAPIPAPGVLGGIFAIWGTFAGLVIVQLFRHQLILGH